MKVSASLLLYVLLSPWTNARLEFKKMWEDQIPPEDADILRDLNSGKSARDLCPPGFGDPWVSFDVPLTECTFRGLGSYNIASSSIEAAREEESSQGDQASCDQDYEHTHPGGRFVDGLSAYSSFVIFFHDTIRAAENFFLERLAPAERCFLN